MKHCCDEMRDHCDDPRVNIFYWPVFREYYISLRGNQAKQTIVFCPWCGVQLPESVRDQYFELLDDDQLEDPPKEFTCETWWKKRNL